MHLVLSLFPGIDLFGRAFELEGFCVVRGPDIIYTQDIKEFHVPRGKFDVIIGGPPCKLFSSVGRWVPNPNENLIPEFERIVSEAHPDAFIMENVWLAPLPHVDGYASTSFVLDSHHYGANQHRERRFTFGYPNGGRLLSFPFHPEPSLPVRRRTHDPFPTILASEGKYPTNCAGRKIGRRLTLGEVCELQGFPGLEDSWCFSPRGTSGKRKVYRKEFEYELIGNGVERRVGQVVARAVRRGLEILGANE